VSRYQLTPPTNKQTNSGTESEREQMPAYITNKQIGTKNKIKEIRAKIP
jgi:hypothetical protein